MPPRLERAAICCANSPWQTLLQHVVRATGQHCLNARIGRSVRAGMHVSDSIPALAE